MLRVRFLFRLGLFVLLTCNLTKGQETRKKPQPKVCPDTCVLKRRIGKIELRLTESVADVKTQCLSEVKSLRSDISGHNITNHAVPATRGSDPVTVDVNAEVKLAFDKFKTDIAEKQLLLNEAVDKIEKLKSSVVLSPTTEDGLRDSRQREVDLRSTIDLMNRTLFTLQQQNTNLHRQTQAIRSQSAVLRAQNDDLANDNKELKKLAHEQKSQATDKLRLSDLEEKLSIQEASIASIKLKIDWLTETTNTLSTSVDNAAYEAAQAAETSKRAASLAKKAISVAKRRTGDNSNDNDETTEEPEELPQPETPPSDCWELYQLGYNKSGVYKIKPWRSPSTFKVFCEQSYNGGGWTLIQRRRDGSVDFDRNWAQYAEGFGELNGEMWLGNDKIYYLTNQDTYVLQVLLLDWEGERAYAEYEGFRLHSNTDYYTLQFGSFTRGTAGDAFRGTTGDGSRNAYLARFSTADVDNDSCRPCMRDTEAFETCSDLQGGGWWFRACSDSNLNGRYIHSRDFSACGDGCYGIEWQTWRGEPNYSLKATIMLVKPLSAP